MSPNPNPNHVEVSGVTLRDSPFWTLHPVYSRHVWIPNPNPNQNPNPNPNQVYSQHAWVHHG